MPPNCRAECVVSSDCSQDKACINQKCVSPCTPGTCADSAICKVVNHNPICSCLPGFTGDPFIRCIRRERKIHSYLSLVHSFIPYPKKSFVRFCYSMWFELCLMQILVSFFFFITSTEKSLLSTSIFLLWISNFQFSYVKQNLIRVRDKTKFIPIHDKKKTFSLLNFF